MDSDTRPSAFIVADHPALDFLNSIVKPNNTEFEWISNGSDLLDWLELANLINTTDAEYFRTSDKIANCDAIAIEARQLRDWFREFIISHAGHTLDTTVLNELSVLNEILAKASNYSQIESTLMATTGKDKLESQLQMQRHHQWRDANDLLVVIAEIMGDLICSADFSLIKNCEGPSCTLWFYDISKNHSRRWCTMSICGNRAKAALHRAKKKALNQA